MSDTIELNTDETIDTKPKKKYPYNLNEEEQILLEKTRKENPNVPFHFILEFYMSIKEWTPEQHKLYQNGDMKELLKTFKDGTSTLKQIEEFEEMSKNLKPAEITNFENARESDEYFKKIIEERDKKNGVKSHIELDPTNIIECNTVYKQAEFTPNPDNKLSDDILADYKNSVNSLLEENMEELKSNTFIKIQ